MEILDRRMLLDNVDGDGKLLREIVDLFFDTSEDVLDAIRIAATRADADSLNENAHQLKGTLANLGARAASQAALRVETLGREGNLTGVAEAVSALEDEMSRLAPELKGLAEAHE